MDASASKRRDAEVDNLFGLYLKIENRSFPSSIKQKKSVIKYTRLPDDINSTATWLPQTYTLEPRLRRIITIEEPMIDTRRSLKSEIVIPSRMMASDICKRKIVKIEEDDEYSLYPKLSHQIRKTYTSVISKAIETEVKEEKPTSQRKVSRLSNSSKNAKDAKPSSKLNVVSSKDKRDLASTKLDPRHKFSKGDNESQDHVTNKGINEKSRSSKNVTSSNKFSLYKKIPSRHTDKEITVTKSKLKDEHFTKRSPKNMLERKSSKSPTKLNRSKISLLKDIKDKNKAITVIHVPLDEKLIMCDAATEASEDVLNFTKSNLSKVDSCIQVENNTKFKDINVGTEELPNREDKGTEIDQEFMKNYYVSNDVKITFDSLDIPNVSLTNNCKNDLPKEHIVEIYNKESPLQYIPLDKDEKNFKESHFCKSTSFIISTATLTYTTKQKINFHVVDNNEILELDSSFNYPMNVVSVYKHEKKNREYHGNSTKLNYEKEDEKEKLHEEVEHSNYSSSVDCSYVFDNDKLVKPSDIISTIKVNNSLLHSDYISEQFQRELNFIDSFFESLQYLDSCSLSEKCLAEKKVENWLNNSGNDLKHFELGSFLSKFENEITIDDSKTMASKSLCLLNLLIRDEQRRAKNLLFVLKMREDALKDFTKSQILWLENKKKQENIDISTLKKKQRGALLKLQHECGEMQRMRKALLTLSEKRKLALKKTKKNIEVKLKNSVNVEQIILGKKKLKRSPSSDRNITPLKCFELSSSGCEDSTTSRPKSAASFLLTSIPKIITSAEKYVQTSEGSSDIGFVDRSTDTADENFIVVDGGYLNILFHNLSMPQIFSSEKQYEVNKEALNNIVYTSNMQHTNWNSDIVIEEIMDQIKNHDLEIPCTPSTARSLVEEYDQIYEGLPENKSHDEGCDHIQITDASDEIKDPVAQIVASETEESQSVQKSWLQKSDREVLSESSNGCSIDQSCTCEPSMVSVGTQSTKGKDPVIVSVSGPLPVPAGAAAVTEDAAPDVPTWLTQKASMSSSLVESSTSSSEPLCTSVSSLTSPVQYEAEELRRQQLAIEREIKALEQQQSQLLAVREIPDKPPPPYTPPLEPKAPKPPRKYRVDQAVEEKIRTLVPEPNSDASESTDPFDDFVKDYCMDSLKKYNLEKNEKYWDTCNFPPTKPELSTEKFIKKTTADLREVLTNVPPTVVSGVGARRSDHIDDILFDEWRRCEPEWTSLHADEVLVKNQIFESIFQKILTETVDEYKQNVLTPKET